MSYIYNQVMFKVEKVSSLKYVTEELPLFIMAVILNLLCKPIRRKIVDFVFMI